MKKLLLLEDDDSLIDGLMYALLKNGYEVQVARTIEEARGLLRENRWGTIWFSPSPGGREAFP